MADNDSPESPLNGSPGSDKKQHDPPPEKDSSHRATNPKRSYKKSKKLVARANVVRANAARDNAAKLVVGRSPSGGSEGDPPTTSSVQPDPMSGAPHASQPSRAVQSDPDPMSGAPHADYSPPTDLPDY